MATYRLFPSTNGPASPVSYSGNFLAGVLFAVSGGGKWFEGYWWWVSPSGQSTSPVKCALWSVVAGGTASLVPGSVVTSGTLTAGAWNYIPLSQPIQLAPSFDPNYSTASSGYIAAIGVNGAFPETKNQFGSGDVYAGGITNGPLIAFSGSNGTLPAPYTLNGGSGMFSTASDPSTSCPFGTDSYANFWVDVQISDTAPAGYTGTYRLWPNKSDANPLTSADSAVNYLVATEIIINQPVKLNNIWYYSPNGTAQLATWAGVWSVAGADSGTLAAVNTNPSWSGVAASGWVSTPITGTLSPGRYKVSIYNNAASPDGWSAKDAGSAYFDLGAGVNGVTWGPLTAPQLSQASAAYEYGGPGNATPPYSQGGVSHGQPTFSMPATGITMPVYPYLWAPVNADNDTNVIHTQNYWVDLEVTLIPNSGLLLTSFP